jgi:hypothetical protein
MSRTLDASPLSSSTQEARDALRELAVPARGVRVPRVLLLDATDSSRASNERHRHREDDLLASARRVSAEAGTPYSSRSYRMPLALIALHDAPVGVDIEEVQQCDAAFAESIQTPRERAAAHAPQDWDRHFTSLWSSKEALSKALGDPLAYDRRRLEGPQAWPQGSSGPWRAAPLDVGAAHVAWVCWRCD